MISKRVGFSFAIPLIVVGAVMSLFGLLTLFQNPVIAAALTMVGAFLWSSTYGIQIDPAQNRFREYGSMFGMKRGEWMSLDKMPYLTVVRGNEGLQVYSQTNKSTTVIDDRFEVCLLNKTHRMRMTVQKFDDRESALAYAERLGTKLDKEVVRFNPEISQKTQQRRVNR